MVIYLSNTENIQYCSIYVQLPKAKFIIMSQLYIANFTRQSIYVLPPDFILSLPFQNNLLRVLNAEHQRLRVGSGETSTSHSVSRANMILRHKNMPYIALNETGGRGNCLYLAMVDQVATNDLIKATILPRAADVEHNHVAIRGAINEFMRGLTLDTWFVKDWLDLEEIREREKPAHIRRDRRKIWGDHLETMGTVGEWADETVLKSAALFFGKDILVISETSNITFDGSMPDQPPVGPPPITVVHMDGCHFQSVHLRLDMSGVDPNMSHLQVRPPSKRTHEARSNREELSNRVPQVKCKGCNKLFTRLLGHLKRSGKSTCAAHYDIATLEADQRDVHLAQMRSRDAERRANQSAEERDVHLSQMRTSEAQIRATQSAEERDARLRQQRESMGVQRSERSAEEIDAALELDRVRHEQAKMTKYKHWHRAAFNYDATEDYHQALKDFIGEMRVECSFGCGALKFPREPKGMCCTSGKLTIEKMPKPPPEPLLSLFEGNTTESKEFLKNPRRYNAAFAMTSFGAEIVTYSGWTPQFKIHGQLIHRIGPLYPSGDRKPEFLQVYFMGDIEDEAERHNQLINANQMDVIDTIHNVLLDVNPYIKSFKTAKEIAPDGEDYKIVIDANQRGAPNIHRGRLNAPAAEEIAIIVEGGDLGTNRDIVLEPREGGLKPICETHRSYDALQYPVLLPYGDDGYSLHLKETEGITSLQLYSFIAVPREPLSHLFKARHLSQMYFTDMGVKVQTERLLWYRLNQKTLRADKYIHLQDSINSDGHAAELHRKHRDAQEKVGGNQEGGQRAQEKEDGEGNEGHGELVILPSSYAGSPRYLHMRTQDAMTYVRSYGRPDLFITMTCNPNWEMIRTHLLPHQQPSDRQDVIARVFQQNVTGLWNMLKEGNIFGAPVAIMYTIEWQKRGLPHCHLLLWLEKKIHSSDIDSIISAELPDPEEDPQLFDIVKSNMIHGPCEGVNEKSPCISEGKCSKRYPRAFIEETQTNDDGYPLYKRRSRAQGGHITTLPLKINQQKQDYEVDNRWIVPYNPFLSKTFNCHINVEFSSSVRSVKYICKYCNKGPDAAMFNIRNKKTLDEIKAFEQGRYCSCNEMMWHLYGFDQHKRWPPVFQLNVHLENGQRVYFTEENVADAVANPRDTHLTAFFKLCQQDEFARTLLYPEVYNYYKWQDKQRIWERRKQGKSVEGHPGIKKAVNLSRVYTVHPKQQDCYYLRLLLFHVRGPTSFEDLRTVEEEVYQYYSDAAKRRGLLEDDTAWQATLQEAAFSSGAKQMRDLFAVMLMTCEMSDPTALWLTFREDMCDDIIHEVRLNSHDMSLPYNDAVFNKGLIDIEDKLLEISGHDLQFYRVREKTDRSLEDPAASKALQMELDYDTEELREFCVGKEETLLPEQEKAYKAILQNVETGAGGLFFLDAPGMYYFCI